MSRPWTKSISVALRLSDRIASSQTSGRALVDTPELGVTDGGGCGVPSEFGPPHPSNVTTTNTPKPQCDMTAINHESTADVNDEALGDFVWPVGHMAAAERSHTRLPSGPPWSPKGGSFDFVDAPEVRWTETCPPLRARHGIFLPTGPNWRA